jgi:carboxypeptidase C (cathepsin A)
MWGARVFAVLALAAALPSAAQDKTSITRHAWRAGGRSLAYVAEAGRLPIYLGGSEPKGEIFYVAYRVPSKTPRPTAFIWNGGPGSAATLVHLEAFGPRRMEDGRFVDNPASLLPTADLVFVDPVGTGYSRAADPESAKTFYSTTGDMAATAEFVQRWRETHHADKAPVYLAGESYGVWRAAGTAELLERKGVPVAGMVLISGGSGVEEPMPRTLLTALRTPNRTAAALALGRLDPSLGKDREALLKQSEAWSRSVYAPALETLANLSPEQREAVAQGLHKWTGYPLAAIDRKTLVVTPRAYLSGLMKDEGKTLNTFDMRITGEPREDTRDLALGYFSRDLGYRTELSYVGLNAQTPDDSKTPVNSRWNYNSGKITPEVMARAQAGEGPPGSEPWAARAMAIDPKLRVFVAAGLYDSLNSCAGNRELATRIDAAIAPRFQFHCYSGGHMMYRDALARAQLSKDLQGFMRR